MSGLHDLGSSLKKAREAKGATLPEAAASTKIKLSYLEALENNLLDNLPPHAYVKGFLKIYTHYLGMPSEPILLAFDQATGAEEPEMVLVPSRPDQAVPWLPKIRWAAALQALAGLLVAGLLAWGVIKLIRGEKIMETPTEGFSLITDPYSPETVQKLPLPAAPAPR
jgi:cytoskeletal protein RodZ